MHAIRRCFGLESGLQMLYLSHDVFPLRHALLPLLVYTPVGSLCTTE
jgi:hypothetical protein